MRKKNKHMQKFSFQREGNPYIRNQYQYKNKKSPFLSKKLILISLAVLCIVAGVFVFLFVRAGNSMKPVSEELPVSEVSSKPLSSVSSESSSSTSSSAASSSKPLPTPTPTPTPTPSAAPISATVTIDPGHGGVQPGAVVGDVLEKDITIAVAKKLETELEKSGITVVMTRDGDDDIKLAERAIIANNAKSDCFVSLHCNSFDGDNSVSGFECYYYRTEESKHLAELISESAKAASIKTRDFKEENFQVLRETTMPATLVELGFMTNPEELEAMMSSDYQDELVSAIAEGIIKMLQE